MQSEAKRFMAALEKRCQLASSSMVSVAQLHALGDDINLAVPDIETFIDQLNDAGTSLKICQKLCMHRYHPSCQHSGYRAYTFTQSLACVQQQTECSHQCATAHIKRHPSSCACVRIAGVILKKGRSMYEIPAAKSKLASLADEQSSQRRSDYGTQQPYSSQILTGSVANPATPSYSETFR